MCQTAQSLYHENIDYGYPFWGDEPYIALAMWLHGCKCCTYEGSVYFGSHAKILKTDLLKSHFEAITYGRRCSAPLLHWSTMKTHHPLYRYEVMRLKRFIKTQKIRNDAWILPFFYVGYAAYRSQMLVKAYAKAAKKKLKERLMHGK